MFKLSVIIPTYNRKVLITRAIASLFQQAEASQLEVIVADDGSTDGTGEHLAEAFPAEVASRQLRIELYPNSGDCGVGRNRGAKLARADHLAFVDSDDYWKPGRMAALLPLLPHHDLILETCHALPDQTPSPRDWIRLFVGMNWGTVSSAVLSRRLFDAIGGFPEGYYRTAYRTTLPGNEDYETWLRALLHLHHEGHPERAQVMEDNYVVIEPQAGGLGRFSIRDQMFREALTLLRVAPRVPPRYWPLLGRRLLGASKAIFLT